MQPSIEKEKRKEHLQTMMKVPLITISWFREQQKQQVNNVLQQQKKVSELVDSIQKIQREATMNNLAN